jgi:hypothetical protein
MSIADDFFNELLPQQTHVFATLSRLVGTQFVGGVVITVLVN